MDEILKDDRFSHIATDPRFKKVPKSQRKVKIDKRFQSIFSDKRFQVKYTVDKRGRPVNQSSSENFKKYYKLSSSDDSEDDDDAVESNEETESNFSSNKLKTKDSNTESRRYKITEKPIQKDKKKISVFKNDSSGDSAESGSSDDETNDVSNTQNLIKIKKTAEELYQTDSIDENDSEEKKEAEAEEEQLPSSSELDCNKKRSKLPEDIRDKLHDLNIDYARGMGTLMTDSSSDEATDEEGEGEEEVEHNWGELDKDAESTETATYRLAICNMDWDRIRAVDLMVLCSSFVPSGGHIKSITIYPSEFGLKRIKEEELKGPIELVREKVEMRADEPDEDNDEEEGSKYHMERLRQYQLNRLKYYYAVVECDSTETASKLYSECDGMEYESSATRLDLRFIPDDVTFDEEPKEVCTEIQDMNKYEPRFFVNTALQQGKVACTWDETDPERTQLAQKLQQMKGDADNLNDEDLQMFLASSSGEDDDDGNDANGETNINENNDEESEGTSSEDSDADNDSLGNKKSNTSKSIEKYRSLLNKIQEDEEKKKNRDIEMEITWGVGLKEKAQMLVDKKLKENIELTPFEKMIEKKKERRKQKKEEKSKKKGEKAHDDSSNEGDSNALFSDDDIPDDVDLNDDYFKEELGNKVTNKNKKKKNRKNGGDNELDEEEKRKRDELELLLIDDEDKDGNIRKNHFSLKNIQQSEESQSRKKRKGRKQIIKNKKHQQVNSTLEEDDFQVNLNDDRFNAVFTSHHFNIDPADPHFRKTKGMDAFINEKISRKYKESSNHKNGTEQPVPTKKPKLDTDISNVVSSIKKKTKGLK